MNRLAVRFPLLPSCQFFAYLSIHVNVCFYLAYFIMAPQVQFTTSQEIVHDRLPDLRYGKFQTKHASVSPFTFSGQCLLWDGFETEVRRMLLSFQWSAEALDAHLSNSNPKHLINEFFEIGNELSLSGRFVQHVLHAMTAVGTDLGIRSVLETSKLSTMQRRKLDARSSIDKVHPFTPKLIPHRESGRRIRTSPRWARDHLPNSWGS